MKKFFAFTSATLLFYLLVPKSVFATAFSLCPSGQLGNKQTFSPFQALCNITFEDTGLLIARIMTILIIIAIVIAVLFLIFGGIKWIISGGDKTKVESARGTIVASIIGLIIALLAIFIIRVVLGLLGITQENFQFPPLVPSPNP